ncbi:hypothetical protein [Maribellus sp. YY47]|uniref:hypothetical protein n=1 Tax=Maribellus sp. YY47 TaxID=2929486 RepID=UPI00200084CD|nr:hypothetical protein [Maribellus sp. YY47]MCK3686044.1 hypothetical protein [Maribellus sp. YY47]
MIVVLSSIFLLSSSGYVIYSSTCLCSGENYTSVFVRPETCETSFHKHHEHDTAGEEHACSAGECHECNTSGEQHNDCGCDSPEVYFFQLKDNVISERSKFIVSTPQLLHVFTADVPKALLSDTEAPENEFEIHSPPLKVTSSFDFLISIQQIKIPSLA